MNTPSCKTSPVIPIVPSADKSPLAPPPGADAKTMALYAAHQKIYPRSTEGFFTRWRWVLVFLTQLAFYGLPWLEWGQRQMVLFDLAARRFYIFKLVLYPQDFIYLTGILVISALSLFLFTAVAGRLWCGYACPQTVYTEIFLWLEKLTEGDRSARLRLDAAPWTMEKIGRKAAKNFLWLAVALWTGLTFVGYFSPIRELGGDFIQRHLSGWQAFWIFFYGFATYGAAGYMREQVCKHMCPYARFQSAMFDKDTLVVTYDAERGEPRGTRAKKADLALLNLGACISCNLCVQVCPTGIDIRNGLQYECIGCGACADACDAVMDKVGYARGLVKYSTENALKHKWTRAQTWRHVLRPRVLIYSAILISIVVAMAVSLALRVPLKVDVVRDRGALARMAPGGQIENVYRLQIMNATESGQRFRIRVEGLPGVAVVSDSEVTIDSTQSRWVPVRVQVPYTAAVAGSHTIHFEISNQDNSDKVVEKSVFLVPR